MADFTRNAIKASLKKLLDERPLAQITVKDIVADCGINRNTFYYHYQGIPELIAEIIDEEADRIVRSHPTLESLEDCMKTIAQTALDHRRAIFHIYHSANRDLYEQYLWRTSDHLASTYLDAALNSRVLPESERNVLLRYYTCVIYGCVSYWLNTGMKEDVLPFLHRAALLQKPVLEALTAHDLDLQ